MVIQVSSIDCKNDCSTVLPLGVSNETIDLFRLCQTAGISHKQPEILQRLLLQHKSLKNFALEIETIRKTSTSLENDDFNHFDNSPSTHFDSLDSKAKRNLGISHTHLDVAECDDSSIEISRQLFRTSWTSILAYGLIADVWKVELKSPSQIKDNHGLSTGATSQSMDNCETGGCILPSIDVLDWEESLRIKLEHLPLKTVSLIHDILVICEAGLKEGFMIEIGSRETEMAKELDSNPVLCKKIMEHLLKHGYEGVESRHLCHSSIIEFIKINTKLNRLPPMPEELQHVLEMDLNLLKMNCSSLPTCAGKANSNVTGERNTERSLTSKNFLREESESLREESQRLSGIVNKVRRGLGLSIRHLHRFLCCQPHVNPNDGAERSIPYGFVESVSIKNNVRIGPLIVDIIAEKVEGKDTHMLSHLSHM